MIDLELLNVIIWAAVLNGVTVLLTAMSLTARATTHKLSPARISPQDSN